MIRNVPLTAVQAAVYKALSSNIRGYNVYDDSTPFEDGELVDSRYWLLAKLQVSRQVLSVIALFGKLR